MKMAVILKNQAHAHKVPANHNARSENQGKDENLGLLDDLACCISDRIHASD